MFKKNNKGQMGLNLLLSVISILFVIGILVMAFVLVGSRIRDSDIMYSPGTAGGVTNETVSSVINGTEEDLALVDYRNIACTLGIVYNESDDLIGSGNYTESSECAITYTGGTLFNNSDWYVSYTYTYDAVKSEAEGVINDTVDAMGESTTFFSIIIIIASVVVLILLIVVIINSLRGSGLIGDGGA